MFDRAKHVFAMIVALAVVSCAAQTHTRVANLKRPERPPRIILMPLDVELSEVTAGGLQEPNAEWTEMARRHVEAGIAGEAQARNLSLLMFSPDKGTEEDRERSIELVKLHRAVGNSILIHQYAGFNLPSKQGRFDWSLGPAVEAIARSHDSDYALFIYIRDSYASAGRVAVIVIAALLGVGVPGGAQLGFASLVDLKTGDIVWFNRLARGAGDLRTPESASETVKVLLTDVPK